MNRICAQIDGINITRITAASNPDWCKDKLGGDWVLVPEGVRPLYNWTYENGEFIPPQIEEESDETE